MHKDNAAFNYSALIGQFIENQHTQERPAEWSDFTAPSPGKTTRITTDIQPAGGRWVVSLLYFYPAHPISFVRVPVKYCRSQHIANIVAAYQRQVHTTRQETRLSSDEPETDWCWN